MSAAMWHLVWPLAIFLTLQGFVGPVNALDLSRLYGHANMIQKRSVKNASVRVCFHPALRRMNSDRCSGEEPPEPLINTAIPGPKTLELKKKLNSHQFAETVILAANYQKSIGNYFCDADGNMLLDLFMQISTLPLGYNHRRILNIFKNEDNLKALINRPALGFYPNYDWPDRIERVIKQIAPKGLNQITPMMCGSCGNENAIKSAFIHYHRMRRGNEADFTDEEKESCMNNMPPGATKCTVLSFKGSFHGRTMGALSATHSKPIHKLDMPAFRWPSTDFPRYKYPLCDNEKENCAEDERCIAMVEEKIKEACSNDTPVAAVLVEPIQSEGGDHHASPEFFHKLQKICKDNSISLIFDEIQTGGGATGKFWCHEYFNLPHPPDIVTFSKRMQFGGYFQTEELRQKKSFRIFNTWMGDPSKLMILEEIINVIKSEDLLKNVVKVGEVVKTGMMEIEEEFPDLVSATRGRGFFLAANIRDEPTRMRLVRKLREIGVQVGSCGENSIRLRPALILTCKHAAVFLDRYRECLQYITCNPVSKFK